MLLWLLALSIGGDGTPPVVAFTDATMPTSLRVLPTLRTLRVDRTERSLRVAATVRTLAVED